MIGFITTATHKRILSNKEAEAEGMARRLRLYADALKKMHRENIELEAKLAVFTAPRQRGPRGRFLSTKGAA
jgi:hypothetical protein